jgi:hypothetical protein
MSEREHYSGNEVLRMLSERRTLTYSPGRGFRIRKAGVVGTGTTRRDAVTDWCRQFSEMISRPKPPPFPDGDTEIHTTFDDPTEEHPSVQEK